MKRSLYVGLVLGAFHTLVLFAALNAVAWVALAALPHDPVSRLFGARPFAEVYPGKTHAEVRALLEETWNRPFAYDPFAVSREPSFQGRYVNVARGGFRLSREQGPWPPDPQRLNVFVFGGSTTFGYGVADSETLVSALQAHLGRRLAPQTVACYNFGRGGYYSSQERILFAELLAGNIAPRLAVFVDGVNDMSFVAPLHAEPLRRYVKAPVFSSLATLVERLPVVQLIARLKARRTERRPPAKLAAIYGEARALDARIDRYLANRRLITASAGAWGVRVLFVWQPAPTYGYDLKYHLFGQYDFGHVTAARFGYPRLAARLRGTPTDPGFLWLADMQQGLHEPLYVDSLHYSAAMNDLVGEAIAEAVLERKLLP